MSVRCLAGFSTPPPHGAVDGSGELERGRRSLHPGGAGETVQD